MPSGLDGRVDNVRDTRASDRCVASSAGAGLGHAPGAAVPTPVTRAGIHVGPESSSDSTHAVSFASIGCAMLASVVTVVATGASTSDDAVVSQTTAFA